MLNILGTNLGGCIVIHEKCEGLTRDISYPNIVEHLRVIKRNFSGDYEVTRMRGQNENRAMEMKVTLHDAEGDGEALH